MRSWPLLPQPRPVRANTGALALMLAGTVRAGFPSPAEDVGARRIDLTEQLIPHPLSTFFWRVRGHAMHGFGIDDGDTLLVDKAMHPANSSLVIAEVDGEYVCRQYRREAGRVVLRTGGSDFPDIVPSDGRIWGVVTYCIKRMPW